MCATPSSAKLHGAVDNINIAQCFHMHNIYAILHNMMTVGCINYIIIIHGAGTWTGGGRGGAETFPLPYHFNF